MINWTQRNGSQREKFIYCNVVTEMYNMQDKEMNEYTEYLKSTD